MSPSKKRLMYSREWSVDALLPFFEKYRRGTANVAFMLSASVQAVQEQLVYRLASGNSIRYEAVKRLIKSVQDYDQRDIKKLDAKSRELLFKRLLWIEEDAVLDEKQLKLDLTD